MAKRRKSVEKMIHQKKTRGHRTSKIIKSRQSGNGHLPYHCSVRYFSTRSMHDVRILSCIRLGIRRIMPVYDYACQYKVGQKTDNSSRRTYYSFLHVVPQTKGLVRLLVGLDVIIVRRRVKQQLKVIP